MPYYIEILLKGCPLYKMYSDNVNGEKFLAVQNFTLKSNRFEQKMVAAFRGMHVSPAKHSYASVTDRQTDRQSDPYVSLCFAGDTKTKPYKS